MHIFIAIVVDADPTAAYPESVGEIFGRSDINVSDQVMVCRAIQEYCSRRYGQPLTAFPQFALKFPVDGSPGMVKFGAAVTVEESILTSDEIRALTEEVSHLGQRIATNSKQMPISFGNATGDTATQHINKVQDDVVSRLRQAHGGRRLPRSLEVRTDTQLVAKLGHVLLSTPDKPSREIPSQVDGRVYSVAFDPPLCVIRPLRAADQVRAYVTSDEMMSKVIAAGLARTALRGQLRVYSDRGTAVAELLDVEELDCELSP